MYGTNVTCNSATLNIPFYSSNRYYLKGYQNILTGDCSRVVATLRTRSLAVAIATGGFQFYQNGTFVSSNKDINHGVALVGYDPKNGFLIRNAWGNVWGTYGYAFVSTSTGVCDYAIAPTF